MGNKRKIEKSKKGKKERQKERKQCSKRNVCGFTIRRLVKYRIFIRTKMKAKKIKKDAS